MTSAPAIMLRAGQRSSAASQGSLYPPPLADAVRQAIRDELQRHDVRIGYSCASAGADIIFGEELIARKGELHVFLPCERGSKPGAVAGAVVSAVKTFEASADQSDDITVLVVEHKGAS